MFTSQLTDVAKELLNSSEADKIEKLRHGIGSGDFPPCSVECSADLLEYAAAQDIPNFGVHAYYALGREPLPTWENANLDIFPKGALAGAEKSTAELSVAASCVGSPGLPPTPGTVLNFSDQVEEPEERPHRRLVKIPSSPFGSPPPAERDSPTWGSNLMNVTDPPKHVEHHSILNRESLFDDLNLVWKINSRF